VTFAWRLSGAGNRDRAMEADRRLTTPSSLSTSALREAVQRLPASVYRCKGFVLTAESPDERMVVQTVGRRSSITSLGRWNGRPRRTDLVVIGAADTLDPEELQRVFDDCRVGSRSGLGRD